MAFKIKLTEMKNADVRFISLVKRGANRIPFRVIKSEKESEMSIDLTTLRRKADKPAPQIVGIVVQPTDEAHLSALSEAIKSAGYEVAKTMKYEDGSTLFVQGEMPDEGDGTIVRLSEHAAIVVKNADEQAETLTDATALEKNLAAEDYFYAAPVAVAALGTAVMEVMKSEDSPADKVAALKQASEHFLNYVTALAQVVPAQALKMEAEVSAAHATFLTQKAEADATAKAEKDAAAAEAAKKSEETVVDAEKDKGTETIADDAAKKDEKPDPMVALLAKLEEISGNVTAIKAEVASVKETQVKLEEKVEETARKADTAKQVVDTTVVASAVKGDEPHGGKKAQKSEPSMYDGYDSAFTRRK